MTTFIILTLAYVAGMSTVSLLGIAGGPFFLLLAAMFFAAAAIPFWQQHGDKLSAGEIGDIAEDENPVPVLSILLLTGACFFFGMFRYGTALNVLSPHHVDRVIDSSNPFGKWRVVGRVIEEPTLKNDYLEVIIAPDTAQEIISTRQQKPRAATSGKGKGKGKGKGRKPSSTLQPALDSQVASETTAATDLAPETPPPDEKTIDDGLILAQVFEENDAFKLLKFNQRIEISGHFSVPSAARNPGSLDYQRSLRNRGIFRTVRIAGRGARLEIIEDDPSGSPWYRFALYLRTSILGVIKQTMPYPESSFLGGVLLGLRGGLPPQVTTEFRKTGVSHVLAVSGLHVTIIAGMFYGLFVMFGVPLRIFSPIIVFFLFTFALIVGWPSSAVRAALMNSLFLLSRAYLGDRGFRASIIFALSVAAAYILTVNPLQLTEPSFVLSFMAIYALAMFSEPAEKLLRECLRGPGLAFAFGAVALLYLVVVLKRDLVLAPYFFPGIALYILASVIVSRRFSRVSGFQSFSFEMLPQWLIGFTSSQIAIFLAMMGPLSAYYFGSMSLSAPIANMIAIPLIGVIVQVGLIAGLIGSFVPVVGLHLALVINAANWLAVKFFLGMAHFFALVIPFPRVSQPGIGLLLLYYALLHLYFFWDELSTYASALWAAVVDLWEDPDYKWGLGLIAAGGIAVFAFLAVFGVSRVESRPSMRLTMLDVGFGASLLYEKDGKTLLVDAGYRDTFSGYDVGERVIQPALSSKMTNALDAVVLTSALPERISGLLSVLDNYRVRAIYAPFEIPTDGKRVPFGEYVRRFSLADMKVEGDYKKGIYLSSPPNYYWEQAADSFNALVKAVNKYRIPVHPLVAGVRIDGFGDSVEILAPATFTPRFSCYYDGAALLFKEGGDRIAYAPGNAYLFEKALPAELNGLLLADLPYPYEKFAEYVRATKPEWVGISFRKPSSWLMERYYMQKLLDGRSIQFNRRSRDLPLPVYRTERYGAIQVTARQGKLYTKTYINPVSEEAR
ncbi:MAG TPA: ComEC/Rec2 family competence protein [Candidatus Ozemobacteraceae bacterium]|nr:ComEC/Rec2 family competence protein [Candidatus Ozemobacteraceae bacterium]